MPLLPRSGAKESAWEVRLGAAAEQTKEAPLGLQARDRILQHTQASVRQSPAQALRRSLLEVGSPSSCRGGLLVRGEAPAHLGMSSLMLISQRFFLDSVS